MRTSANQTSFSHSNLVTLEKRITSLLMTQGNMTLEPVTSKTLTQFLTIKRTVFGGSKLKTFLAVLDFFTEKLTRERVYDLLVKVGKDTIGIVTVDFICDIATISNVALLEDYRGKGHGIQMIKRVLNYSYDGGANFVKLQVHKRNTIAYNLYGKFGFREPWKNYL